MNDNKELELITGSDDTKPKKRKKVKYVPDDDVMNYIRNKYAQNETRSEVINATAESESTETTTLVKEVIVAEETENIYESITETEEIIDGPMANVAEEAESNATNENATENDVVEESNSAEDKKNEKKNIFAVVFGTIFPKKGDSTKKIALKSTALIAALAILVSGGYLVYYFGDLGVQNQVINHQRAIYDLNRYDYYTATAEGYLAKFSELKRQNNDLVGWISIEGTEVDNPVYQRDNEFYLNHDMNGKTNSYGSLFLDQRCDLQPSRRTQNQIIYGHNMRYGAMFGTLDEYRKINYYKHHPVVSFDSLWEHNEYKIFAIMVTSDTVDTTFGYNFTAYRNNFVNQEDFLLWTEYCKQRSLINTTVDIQPDDEVITLSTCCYDFPDARLIIVGRLVRPGESSDVDVESASVNKDVIYCKEYYEKKKLPIPKVEPPVINIYDR